MKILFWMITIFLIELTQSYFADRRTVAIVGRKKWRATIYDVIAEGLGWTAIALIVVNRLYIPYILCATAGNAIGTFLVSGRKHKKKKIISRKKFPVSTA